MRGLEFHALEVIPVEDHVLALADLVALDQVAAAHRLTRSSVDGLHPDAVVGLRIDQVESNGFRFAGRRIERDRTGD